MPAVRAALRQVLGAVGLGVALGAASWFSDQLAWPWQLVVPANAVGAWLSVAFVAGATGRNVTLGTLRGMLALLAGVAVYYVLIGVLGEGIRVVGAGHAATVWGVVAVLAGPVLGAAGALWRHGRGWPRAVAVALLAAALMAEGVAFGGARLVAIAQDPSLIAVDPAALLFGAEAAIGLLLPAIFLDRGERLRGYVALVVVGVVAVVAIGPVVDLVRGLADRF